MENKVITDLLDELQMIHAREDELFEDLKLQMIELQDLIALLERKLEEI